MAGCKKLGEQHSGFPVSLLETIRLMLLLRIASAQYIVVLFMRLHDEMVCKAALSI